jgi:hypothetical protein
MRNLAGMRTTINLEPEALARAKILSHQRGVPLGTIISDLILKATQSGNSGETRNGVPIFPRRTGTSPDMDIVNELRD